MKLFPWLLIGQLVLAQDRDANSLARDLDEAHRVSFLLSKSEGLYRVEFFRNPVFFGFFILKPLMIPNDKAETIQASSVEL